MKRAFLFSSKFSYSTAFQQDAYRSPVDRTGGLPSGGGGGGGGVCLPHHGIVGKRIPRV